MKKALRIIALIFALVFVLSACAKEEKKETLPEDNLPNFVSITVKDMGTMIIELYPDKAPKTVANFKKLVNEGFYDGLTFHRVVADFMVQTGDPTATGMGGSSERIFGEFAENGFDNPIKHERGTVSMARATAPNTASSQFFIVHQTSQKNTLSLDGNYAAFGKVIEGIEVVDKIAAEKTDVYDKPINDVIMEKVCFTER